MAATALIKFTQGATVGSGQAISGVTGQAVTIENVDNTGVASWRIDLLDAPSNSALTPGILAQGNSATPSATLTPDVDGGAYRFQLVVWPQASQGGTPDIDIRNVVVPDAAGFATPPSQIWPPPLPPTPSGSSGNKPNELNLGGQERGWAGTGGDGLLDQRFRYPRQADALREAGGVVMVATTIADGALLARSGTRIVGTTVGAGGAGISAGSQSVNTGTVVFANSNGLTFGMSGSSQITGSYTVPTTAGLISAVNASAGTTSQNLSAIVFSNSNNVSFGLNGSTVTASASQPAQTVQPGIVGISAGTQSATTGTVKFADSNGISFGIGSGASTSQLTASYTVPTVPAQTNQTVGAFAVGNTTGQSSSTTVDARSLSVQGAGIVSVGYSNASLIVSAPTPAAQTVQTQGVVVPSAGTQTATSGTAVFANSNGVTFGMSGSSQITASYSQSTAPAAISAGTTSANSGTVVFSNSNGVSFGMSGNTITATVNPGAAAGIAALGAGTQTATSGTIVWSNSNGISFGMSGSSQITASYTVPTVPAQLSVGVSTGGNTSGDTALVTGRVVLAGGNNITLSGSSNAGSYTISISAPNAVAQTNQTDGIYFGGNTTGQSSSSTHDARSLSVQGDGIISVGWSNSSMRISATVAAQTVQTQNVVVPSAGTQTATSGTVIFSNSNGISFGMSNSSVVTASYTVPTVPAQFSGGLSNVGNTSGDTVVVSGRLVLAGGNNITVSGSSNAGSMTITISAPNAVAQTNQTVGLYGLGNTTQNSSTTLDARTLSFNGLGAMTVGYSNGSIQLSVPAQTAQTQSNIQAIYDGANSISTGTIRFTNANGVSFSVNGQTISGSVAAQTNQTVGMYALGNTTQNSSTTLDARTLSLNGLGIVTAGYSNGSIQISATQSAQTVGLYASSNTTGQSSSSTVDARSLSFRGDGIASVGMSAGLVVISVPAGGGAGDGYNILAGGGVTAGTTGTIVFSNSNGVSFGLGGGASTSIMTASVSVQTDGYYAVGNTTQNSSTTLDPRTQSFNFLGAMTGGFSNGSVQISAPPVSSIVGTGGISISTNGSTISISEASLPMFEPFPFSNSSGTAPGAGTWYVQGFTLPYPMAGGRINRYMNASGTANILLASTASFNSGSTGSRSVSFSYVNSLALYALGAGTNSTRLESFWSNSFSIGLAQSVSVSSGGATNLSVTNAATMSYVVSMDGAGAYTTTTLAGSTSRTTAASTMNTSGVSGATTSFSNILSGSFVMPVGLNTTLNPGIYWLAQAYSTASTTGGTSIPAASVWSVISQYGMSASSAFTNFRIWGQSTATSGSQFNPGEGFYSVVSAAPPTTMAFSDIRSMASNFKQYFNIINSTI